MFSGSNEDGYSSSSSEESEILESEGEEDSLTGQRQGKSLRNYSEPINNSDNSVKESWSKRLDPSSEPNMTQSEDSKQTYENNNEEFSILESEEEKDSSNKQSQEEWIENYDEMVKDWEISANESKIVSEYPLTKSDMTSREGSKQIDKNNK